MKRIVMVLTVLVVATEAAAWVYENGVGQHHDATSGGIDKAVTRIASAEATLAATLATAEVNETTRPTEPALTAEPASKENLPNLDLTASQVQLDLDALEERIRRTDALGFFTKLSLKNQVDDLLSRFRTYHNGKSDLTIEQLRERYDLLLLKLVSLLADDDARLSHDIFVSHGSIWNMLADPAQFAKLQES